jgi:hypothetical protein
MSDTDTGSPRRTNAPKRMVTVQRSIYVGDRTGFGVMRWGRCGRAEIDTFMNGQCHSFALALSEATGWPVVARGWFECLYDEACTVTEPVCSCQLGHLQVLAPDGRAWDATGPHDGGPDSDGNVCLALDRVALESIMTPYPGSTAWFKEPVVQLAQAALPAWLANHGLHSIDELLAVSCA